MTRCIVVFFAWIKYNIKHRKRKSSVIIRAERKKKLPSNLFQAERGEKERKKIYLHVLRKIGQNTHRSWIIFFLLSFTRTHWKYELYQIEKRKDFFFCILLSSYKCLRLGFYYSIYHPVLCRYILLPSTMFSRLIFKNRFISIYSYWMDIILHNNLEYSYRFSR